MFNNISKKFTKIIKKISGYGRITENDIKNTLRKIRTTLLEADVSLILIKKLIQNIRNQIIGNDINNSLTPGQEVVKILKQELISIMSSKNSTINFSIQPPAIFLIIGMQGSGKTTSTIKLGKFIQQHYKKTVLVASTDIYRPAAIKQLEILSKKHEIDFFKSKNHDNALIIGQESVIIAKKKLYDVLIIDTAGRLHIDEKMMNELCHLQKNIHPIEILFVLDAMMGQETINIVQQFNQYLKISGLILTKIDSDTRSGSALSASYITQKPIKFIGTGEKIESFDVFNPENIASKILGMDDIFSIIDDIEKKINIKKIQKNKKKIKKKNKFDFYDFKIQIQQIDKIGGIENILSKLPTNKNFIKNLKTKNNKNYLIKIESMINSMTHCERQHPEIIKGSRKKRIALGSGNKIQDVNKLLKQFYELKNIMKKIQKNGIQKTIQHIKNMLPNIF